MENIQNFQVLWFILIAILFLGYSLLDGFDLGIGALLPFIGRNKEDKDILISSIGPFWDGNEVWLITGGGALFAAFPQAYATAFSGFYPAMLLVLFALIFRAVSMEFRAHDETRAAIWERAFILGSGFAAFLFGVALGNAVYGVPLDNRMEFTGNFFTLLRPVPLLFGVVGLAAVLLQGASYAVRKTEGELRERSFRAVNILAGVNAAAAVAYYLMLALTFADLARNPLFYAAVISTLLGLTGIFFSVKKKNEEAPFWESSFSFAGLWLAAGAAHFPNMIRSAGDPGLSITIYNASTGLHTLKIISIIALVGMPIVIAYTIFVHRIFKGKTGTGGY